MKTDMPTATDKRKVDICHAGNVQIFKTMRRYPWIVSRMDEQRRCLDIVQHPEGGAPGVIVIGTGKAVAGRDEPVIEFIYRPRAGDCRPFGWAQQRRAGARLHRHPLQQPPVINRIPARHHAGGGCSEIYGWRNRNTAGYTSARPMFREKF